MTRYVNKIVTCCRCLKKFQMRVMRHWHGTSRFWKSRVCTRCSQLGLIRGKGARSDSPGQTTFFDDLLDS